MGHFSSDLRRRIRRQHGIATGDQLRNDGITPEMIERWRLRQLIVPVHVDLYRIASGPDTFEARCVAATISHPAVVIGGAAAAALWDFDHVFRPTRPECLHPRDMVIARPVGGVSYRAVRAISPSDIVDRGDTIRVLSRAATWLDCVGQMSIEHGGVFTEHVLESQCDPGELWDVVDRREATRRGSPGRAHMVLSSWRPTRRRRSAA